MSEDFYSWWDYSDPAATERRFRDYLPNAGKRATEVKIQIARTLGLQGRFDEAFDLLDEIEPLIANPTERVRFHLEKGRALNSSKMPEQAVEQFRAACTLAIDEELHDLAADAAHMMAIALPLDEQIEWADKGLAIAEHRPEARRWKGPLLNNLGWTYMDLGQPDKALSAFEEALEFRRTMGQAEPTRIAVWCVARALRELCRPEEALTLLRQIEPEKDDPYVSEEIANCLAMIEGKT